MYLKVVENKELTALLGYSYDFLEPGFGGVGWGVKTLLQK